jgi:hypothetical protein
MISDADRSTKDRLGRAAKGKVSARLPPLVVLVAVLP